MLQNPILTGFHADPCICRKGDDYYIAVSSFEWFPGIPIYHSRDMKHWELYTHALTDERTCNLKGLPSAKGIWAPCLTYCEEDGLFYVVYGIMHSMNARYFDIDNYLITARDIRGPWSEPVYLHSSGFDASLFHDRDGRKWLVALDWETRTGYEKPGQICIVEYDPKARRIKGLPQRIWRGGTDRGCLEAPHLTRHGDYYYLMCAEGGTGYYHAVTMARSLHPLGPYEGDPANPILTAVPENRNERADVDHLKPHFYNPASYLQKCGHASYVETALGETYLVHLCARPFTPELRCTLGRETGIQKMKWTENGWLHLASGGNMAEPFVEESRLPDWLPSPVPDRDDFDSPALGIAYYAPRIDPHSFCDLTARPGWLRMRGQESGCSVHKVSLLARKLKSVHSEVMTCLEFDPEVYQQSAGLILYYDNMNFAYLRKYYSNTLQGPALSVLRIRNGEREEYERIPAGKGPVWMRLLIEGRQSVFSYSADGKVWHSIGPAFDTSEFSDEYSQYGEFTGCFVGITCADRMLHQKCADFDFFLYRDLKPDLLPDSDSRGTEAHSMLEQNQKIREKVQSLTADFQENERSHNSYLQEQREQECIRTGNLDGLLKTFGELEIDKVGTVSKDAIRNMKDIAIVVIGLSARSAIEGGVPSEMAFSMCDVFIQQVEAQKEWEKIGILLRNVQVEYCLTVQTFRHSQTKNHIVIRCRELIMKRIATKLTVQELAAAMHIHPDYLSQLFSREEGLTLSEYISREKAHAVRNELLFTRKSYDDIAASLSFSSQSHMGKVFKKWTGMTPGQYRTLYGESKKNDREKFQKENKEL